MNIKESIIVSVIGVLFFGSVISAAPSTTPTGGNRDVPINALALPQYKVGEATSGYVNRALGVGYSQGSLPLGVTLGVGGQMKIGTLSGGSDGMYVFGDMTDMYTTVLCKTGHSYTSHSVPCGGPGTDTNDGNITVTGLIRSGTYPDNSVCIQLINNQKQLVRCP